MFQLSGGSHKSFRILLSVDLENQSLRNSPLRKGAIHVAARGPVSFKCAGLYMRIVICISTETS